MISPFIFDRRLIFNSRVTTIRIAPTFDELKDLHPGFRLVAKPASINQLALECCKETFTHRMVIAITDSPHRRPHTGFATSLSECYRGVLSALISSSGMMNYSPPHNPSKKPAPVQACGLWRLGGFKGRRMPDSCSQLILTTRRRHLPDQVLSTSRKSVNSGKMPAARQELPTTDF